MPTHTTGRASVSIITSLACFYARGNYTQEETPFILIEIRIIFNYFVRLILLLLCLLRCASWLSCLVNDFLQSLSVTSLQVEMDRTYEYNEEELFGCVTRSADVRDGLLYRSAMCIQISFRGLILT